MNNKHFPWLQVKSVEFITIAGSVGLVLFISLIALVAAKSNPTSGLLVYGYAAATLALIAGAAGAFVGYGRLKAWSLPPQLKFPPYTSPEEQTKMNRQLFTLSGLLIGLALILFVAV